MRNKKTLGKIGGKIEQKELSEVGKAQKIIAEAEQAKQKEFAEKMNALCKEYGYALDVQSQIVIKKT